MSGYVLACVDKRDLEIYQKYSAQGFVSLQGQDVEVTVAEAPKTLEGQFPGSTLIMLKFKTLDDAQRWYDSDAYQAAIPFRHAAGKTPFVIIFPGMDQA